MRATTAELEAFLVLAGELHFGRTAARLQLSPARVSRLIASLEGQVGGRLFDRTSRVVTLTPLGRSLRDRLQPAYEAVHVALADTAAQARTAELSIGFTRTTEGEPLQRLVRAFRAAHPECRVVFHEVELVGPHYDELRRGEIDVLVDWLLHDDPELTAGPAVDHQRRLLAVSTDHPLAGRPSVSVEDLADWEHAGNPALPAGLMDGFLPPATPSGRPLRRTVVVGGMTELLAHVANGWIVHATVESMRTQARRDDIVMLPIRDMPALPLGLVHRAGADRRSPYVRALVETVGALGAVRDAAGAAAV